MTNAHVPEAHARPVAERLAAGKALRKRVPRSAHAHWEPAPDRPDPVALLETSSQGRVPELIPVRYGRMLPSPFAFYRGSAGAMAFDLAASPVTGIRVQLCGDAHLMNFGAFATPERHFVFDLTDFDETLPGPWEWDVKRLAASVVLAARTQEMPKRVGRDAAVASVRSYRKRMRASASMRVLERWYARIDGEKLGDLTHGTDILARRREADHLLLKISEVVDGRRRFVDHPPLLYHMPHGHHFERELHHFLARYRESLQDDRRHLLARYEPVDVAMKVVGVGSVGSRCAVLLMTAGDDDALILQYKEAGPSVLEPFVGKCKYHTHGHRVVSGQRLLQAASDLFLGWSSDEDRRDFYFRQLRDMKTSVRVEGMTAGQLTAYAGLCGEALARAHAKAGDPALIAGYLGGGDAFDRAVAAFAETYADQTERDHAVMARAVREGRLAAHAEAPR